MCFFVCFFRAKSALTEGQRGCDNLKIIYIFLNVSHCDHRQGFQFSFQHGGGLGQVGEGMLQDSITTKGLNSIVCI